LHRFIGSHHGGTVISGLFRYPGIIFREDYLKGTVTQHVLDPSDIFTSDRLMVAKVWRVCIMGLYSIPALSSAGFQMTSLIWSVVNGQWIPVNVEEDMARFSTYPISLVNQCLYHGG